MAKKKNPAKVVTGVCRSSYLFVRELRHKEEDGVVDTDSPKTCGVRIIIKKSDKDTLKQIEKAVKFAAEKKFGKGVKMSGKKFQLPLHDGDEELKEGDLEGDEYKKHHYLNSRAYSLPQIADENGTRIIDPEELDSVLTSGYYFHFSVTFKGFDRKGNKGVRVELNNLMFVKEGDRLDGGANAEDDFADIGSGSSSSNDDDEEDEDNNDNAELFEEIKEAYDEYVDDNSRKEAKAILKNYDIKKISELSEVDEDDLDDLLNDLKDE